MTPARYYLHALAERLGKTVGEIERIPARELIDWLSYDRAKVKGGPQQTPAMMRAELQRASMRYRMGAS